MIDLTSGTLGEHFRPFSDLLEQMQHLLTDPSPGGVTAYKDELIAQVDQLQSLVTEAQEKVNAVTSAVDMLSQLANTLTNQLQHASVTKVEVQGTLPEILGEVAAGVSVPEGQKVYGVLLLAALPDAQQAISSVLGIAQKLNPQGGTK